MWGRKEQPYLDNKEWGQVNEALKLQADRAAFIGKTVKIYDHIGIVIDVEINPYFSFGDSQKPIRVSLATPNGGRHISYIKAVDEIELLPSSPAAPKNTVTQEQIDALIAGAKIERRTVFAKCTIVSVHLENGFVLTESSACVDPANFDPKIGEEICMERIKDKLWELEGYALQKKLYEERYRT